MFWEVGLTQRPTQYFTDPEQWNSYSYVRNNPVNLVDPTGESIAGDSNPVQDFVWILGTVIKGYWEMGKFFTTEGVLLLSTVGTFAVTNQPLVDATLSGYGSTSPPPGNGNPPPNKKPEKPKFDLNKVVDVIKSKLDHANSKERFITPGIFKNIDGLSNFMTNQTLKNLNNLKIGMNDIQVVINKVNTTVRVNVNSDGTLQSINSFVGFSKRTGVNIIKSTF